MKKIQGLLAGRNKFMYGLLALYLYVALTLQALCGKANIGPLLFLSMVPAALLAAFLLYMLLQKLADSTIWFADNGSSAKKTALLVLGITLLLYVVNLAVQLPIDYPKDIEWQQYMGKSHNYNNWIPFLYILLYYDLPMRLCDSLLFITILQILYFCASFSYLIYVLLKNGMRKIWVYLCCITVWCSPFMLINMPLPLKDAALFTIGAWLMAFYVQIFCTDGAWLSKKRNALLFGVVLIVCTYMRHNGILFTLPLLAVALFYGVKKWSVRGLVAAVCLVCYGIVQILQTVLAVEAPNQRVIETMGLPATVICEVMHTEPKALSQETQNTLYKVAPKAVYAQMNSGEFNSVKYAEGFDRDKFDALGYGKAAQITLECFAKAPNTSIKAVARLTAINWGLFFYKFEPNGGLGGLAKGLTYFVFGSVGWFNLAFIGLGLVFLARKKWKIFHALPLLCYNFGTMLMLSGHDVRFFLLNVPIWFAVLFVMLKNNSNCDNM